MDIGIVRLPVLWSGEIWTQKDTVISFPMHSHDFYEMTLYKPFDGVIVLNGQEISMDKKPTAVLITPNDFHRICPQTEHSAEILKVCFDEQAFVKGEKPKEAMISVGENPLLEYLFLEIISESRKPQYANMLISAAAAIIADKGRYVFRDSGSNQFRLASKAADYVNRRYQMDISLEDAAREAAVTPQYLSRIFAREMGLTFSEYLSRLRLRQAAALLCYDGKSVTEACYASGFGNVSHFIRCFKAHYGVPPGKYALSMRKNG